MINERFGNLFIVRLHHPAGGPAAILSWILGAVILLALACRRRSLLRCILKAEGLCVSPISLGRLGSRAVLGMDLRMAYLFGSIRARAF
jgi:hypothetical protein